MKFDLSVLPHGLVIIVIFQTLVLFFHLNFKQQLRATARVRWILALLIGAGFGALMDVVLGKDGIFAYLPAGQTDGYVQPLNLPKHVLLFNALASYGLASITFATVKNNIVSTSPYRGLEARQIALIPLIAVLAVTQLKPASIEMMFAWGAAIVGGGELLLRLRGYCGPFWSLVSYGRWQPAMWLFLYSLAIGVFYETANWLFPFWLWLPGSGYSQDSLRILVAGIGYVSLVHPIISLYTLLSDEA